LIQNISILLIFVVVFVVFVVIVGSFIQNSTKNIKKIEIINNLKDYTIILIDFVIVVISMK
jgi:hypothetical protein